MNFIKRIIHFVSGVIQFSLYSALFFILMVGAGYWVALQYFGGSEVKAPDLTGLDMVPALARLQPLHISLELERMQPHVQVPEGHIISQFPSAGTVVKSGTPIRVVVSEGQPLVTVPDLRGSNKIEAGIRLRKLGLAPGTIATIPREGVPGGTVLTTDPPAGTGVIDGSAVNLMLAAGEGTRVAQMPNLIGLTRDEAREVLGSYNLKIADEIARDAPDVTVGHIHDQTPGPGEPLAPDQRITVVYQPPRAELPPQGATGDQTTDPAGGQTGGWPDSFLREPGAGAPDAAPPESDGAGSSDASAPANPAIPAVSLGTNL